MEEYRFNALTQGLRDLGAEQKTHQQLLASHDRSSDLNAREMKNLLSRQVEIAEKMDDTLDRVVNVLEDAVSKMSMPPWAVWMMRVLVGLTAVIVALVLGKEGVQAFLALFH